MSPNELLQRITKMRANPSTMRLFERALSKRGYWSGSSYASQKQHWIAWLSEYNGPGYYGPTDWKRSAEFI